MATNPYSTLELSPPREGNKVCSQAIFWMLEVPKVELCLPGMLGWATFPATSSCQSWIGNQIWSHLCHVCSWKSGVESSGVLSVRPLDWRKGRTNNSPARDGNPCVVLDNTCANSRPLYAHRGHFIPAKNFSEETSFLEDACVHLPTEQ